MSPTPTVVVAGTSSGVGKTTVTVAIMHALHKKFGLRVQPFKVGPDFLDGMQHETAVGGTKSINLDGWMMGRDGCLEAFHEACIASKADVAIIEGCMGLHDGRDGMTDEGSTAQVAKWLDAPVLLVLDAWSLARSAAAMVLGYKEFDPRVRLGGVIFNRVAGTAHADWIAQAMASAPSTADVAVVGCLPTDKKVAIEERLLGLLPPNAPEQSAARLAALLQLVTQNIDLDAVRALAASAAPPPPPSILAAPDIPSTSLPPVRIAVAHDAAFCFTYEDNLRLMRAAGATLVTFSPLGDEAPPHRRGRALPRRWLPRTARAGNRGQSEHAWRAAGLLRVGALRVGRMRWADALGADPRSSPCRRCHGRSCRCGSLTLWPSLWSGSHAQTPGAPHVRRVAF